MSNIPFEQQVFPITVEQIDHQIALGKAVSGDELLHAIEWSVGQPLDDRLRKVVSAFSVVAVKRRGRPGNFKGREDFALRQVDARYPALLQKYEGEARQRRLSAAAKGSVLPSAERTPSELAYTKIQKMKGVKAVFPNVGWQALRNLHSAWKKGHFHSLKNDIRSDDFDAEIDRLFPAPPES
jgi:hypothetical protein